MGYTIKEVAEKLNISQYTLRYYDKEGLIPYLKREKNGIRRYTDEDIDWINMIISLRNIDMPITKIHEYITLYLQGDKTIEQRRELIQKYKRFIENKRYSSKFKNNHKKIMWVWPKGCRYITRKWFDF